MIIRVANVPVSSFRGSKKLQILECYTRTESSKAVSVLWFRPHARHPVQISHVERFVDAGKMVKVARSTAVVD